jgi:phage portal protein BeeE
VFIVTMATASRNTLRPEPAADSASAHELARRPRWAVADLDQPRVAGHHEGRRGLRRRLVRNGAIPGIIATHPRRLTPRPRRTSAVLAEEVHGRAEGEQFAILEEGIKIDVVGVDPQKSQLKELRDDQISAAARIWRVPNLMIQNHTKDTSWGSGVEQLMLGWINGGLGPYLTQWTQAIWRDLLSNKAYARTTRSSSPRSSSAARSRIRWTPSPSAHEHDSQRRRDPREVGREQDRRWRR